jgi:hypothetical protein
MSEPTSFDILRIRQHLGRKLWMPPESFGPAGFKLTSRDNRSTVLVTEAPAMPVVRVQRMDGHDWIHASIAHADELPSYDELVQLKQAVWGDVGFAYQVFAAAADHVNHHPYALHLWGRADGEPVLPRFGRVGLI